MSVYKELKVFAKDLRILIVEDEKILNAELVEISKLFFKDVLFAYSGEDALKIYKQESMDIDIVLSDITMPGMDGVALSRKIKLLNDEQSIVILSAHSEMSYIVELIDIGIRQFVHKPFDDKELLFRLLKVSESITLMKAYKEHDAKSEKLIKVTTENPNHTQTESKAVGHDVIAHKALNSESFMDSLQSDEFLWLAFENDIATLLELQEDFEYIVSGFRLNSITQKMLFSFSKTLRKVHTIFMQMDSLTKISQTFLDLIYFIEDLDYKRVTQEQINHFKMLEFIYEDISRFIETVFIHKDTIDIHYLEDSLGSSLKQLKQSVLQIPIEEEELELF